MMEVIGMEQSVLVSRPDIDIQADIERNMLNYPPLAKDRHSVKVQVNDGIVKLSGHVQTPNTRQFFLNAVPTVEGVVSVDGSELFDDESIRLEVGRLLPVGLNVGRSQYGNVVLVGRLPEGMSADEVEAKVREAPGVRQVIAAFA
jgi:osmotically-inducible protein OsmY